MYSLLQFAVSFVAFLSSYVQLSEGFHVRQRVQLQSHCIVRNLPAARASSTRLNVLVDVPDGFFTFTFPVLGVLLSLSRSFGRLRMEERAWEQRLEEAREKRLLADPTVTEIELRRREAAVDWSAYGEPGMSVNLEGHRGKSRLTLLEENDSFDTRRVGRNLKTNYQMSDEEIELFEAEYGISYDPYYDEPYSEDELPTDVKFNTDRQYGDRIYENGEVFYKEKESGLFYRQGAKPRTLSFWNQQNN
mmetsp:Transcript_79629/g.231170  ORF Transcript_79629/g.231170 Transcript_79629/m.231170 type:complete len:247 (+) Transcript_79629:75-815(+)